MSKVTLSVFLSFSIFDRKLAGEISHALRDRSIDVINFLDTEPLGAKIKDWVSETLSDVDCVLVLLTKDSIANPTWIEREVGLATKLILDGDSGFSNIIPICSNISISDLSKTFQPRDYDSSEPLGPPIIWAERNCLMLDRDGMSECLEKFIDHQKPNITLIKDPDSPSADKIIFESGISLYKTLLPDERVRDKTRNIKEWIYKSWDFEGNPNPDEIFLHYFLCSTSTSELLALFGAALISILDLHL